MAVQFERENDLAEYRAHVLSLERELAEARAARTIPNEDELVRLMVALWCSAISFRRI